jgi:hypothetical protein
MEINIIIISRSIKVVIVIFGITQLVLGAPLDVCLEVC